jgi:hypothetical protein
MPLKMKPSLLLLALIIRPRALPWALYLAALQAANNAKDGFSQRFNVELALKWELAENVTVWGPLFLPDSFWC